MFSANGADLRSSRMDIPCAPIRPRKSVLHGVTLSDPYAWMADIDDPETKQYLAAERRYAESATGHLAPIRKQLFDELRKRLAEDDCDVPERIGDYYYYSRSLKGKSYPVHCRRRVGEQAEAVFLDENLLAAGYEYYSLGSYAICPRHRIVAYVVDTVGDESYCLFIKDIETGELLETPIKGVAEDICWSEDAAGVFYLRVDQHSRPFAAALHILGTSAVEDRVVYQEPDAAFYLSLWKSRSRAWIFIESHSNSTSEVHFVDSNGSSEVRCFRNRRTGIEYCVDHRPGQFLVLTNEEAPNFRLYSVAENDRGGTGQELAGHRDDVTLEYVDVYRSHIVLCERVRADTVLRVIDMDNGSVRTIDLPESVNDVELVDLDDFDSPDIWIEYSAPAHPDVVYAYPLAGGAPRTLKIQAPEGFQSDDYNVVRLWVPVDGATEVPLTVIKKASVSGPAPLMLRGYGAYEYSYETCFEPDTLSLLERGVVVATAHVRGGGELGRSWYTSGKLLQKNNSFLDFLACADYLVDHGYTTTGQIAAYGASAGGLLVGVAVQRRPELFAAVIAEVPFVDVINTLLNRDLPLTEHDLEEFGDPTDKDSFQYLLDYSPYDNVHNGSYPPLLVTAAIEDQRVGYWEPLKWVARIRASKNDNNPVILKIDDAGHLGPSGRYQGLEHTAYLYAFLLDNWGLLKGR